MIDRDPPEQKGIINKGTKVIDGLDQHLVGRRRDDGGMGLGVFIAKTLLERTGGEVSFGNYRDPGGRIGGAEVAIAWPRGILDLSIQ